MEKGIKYISELSWNYRAAKVLHICNHLGIFTALSGKGSTAEQLSQVCGVKSDMLEKLLIACTAMGLLLKEGDLYNNSELSEKYLVRGIALYQGDIVSHSAAMCRFWDNLEEELCSAESPRDQQEQGHHNFIMGMHNIAVGCRGELFLAAIDLSGRKKLFDVGGGPGSYSILACQKYPLLRATVFDLPETIKITREMIAQYGLGDRVVVREGDWTKDDFGRDNDAVLFSNVLHGPDSNCELKLKKAYDSMSADGLLIVQEFLLRDDKSGPLLPALFNIMVGAYSYSELVSLIEGAGFIRPQLVRTSEDIGASWITATKP